MSQSQTDDQRLIAELRLTLAEQRTKIADLIRHNQELREAIDALLQPAPSELLSKNLTHPSHAKTSGK